MNDVKDKIAEAAFRLFATRGYDATSAEDIASEAGVSRSTFFRAYGSKEAVIFPDHDEILAAVERRLRAPEAGPTQPGSALAAVTEAVKIVLFHYVSEGDRARERYRLTSTVSALRERELVSGARYQRLFRRYLSQWGDQSESSELRAELMAAAVVTAHNRVLRRWLRGESTDPQREMERALATVHRLYGDAPGEPPVAVVVVPSTAPMNVIEEEVRAVVARTLGG